MPKLTFVGTGEAFDPELPNTSVLYQGSLALLVDCGFGALHALWRVMRDPSLLDAVYLTHWHADHCFGLPSLLLWMREEGRRRPLEVIGGPGVAEQLTTLCEVAYPGAFERSFPVEAVELSPGSTLRRADASLRNARSSHSLPNFSLRIDEGTKSYCHSGDGCPTDETRELYRGATLLAHECYFAERAHPSHARATDLLPMAEALGVETLALVHLGRHEKARIAALAAGAARRVEIPGPGDSFDL